MGVGGIQNISKLYLTECEEAQNGTKFWI